MNHTLVNLYPSFHLSLPLYPLFFLPIIRHLRTRTKRLSPCIFLSLIRVYPVSSFLVLLCLPSRRFLLVVFSYSSRTSSSSSGFYTRMFALAATLHGIATLRHHVILINNAVRGNFGSTTIWKFGGISVRNERGRRGRASRFIWFLVQRAFGSFVRDFGTVRLTCIVDPVA